MSAKIPYPLGTKQGENCGDKFDTSTNLCDCNNEPDCRNDGIMDPATCSCNCAPLTTGAHCEITITPQPINVTVYSNRKRDNSVEMLYCPFAYENTVIWKGCLQKDENSYCSKGPVFDADTFAFCDVDMCQQLEEQCEKIENNYMKRSEQDVNNHQHNNHHKAKINDIVRRRHGKMLPNSVLNDIKANKYQQVDGYFD